MAAECCICCCSVNQPSDLNELQAGDVVEETFPVATKCGHLFHNNCLDRWLRTKRVCPNCKTRVPSGPSGVIRIYTSLEAGSTAEQGGGEEGEGGGVAVTGAATNISRLKMLQEQVDNLHRKLASVTSKADSSTASLDTCRGQVRSLQ